MVATALTWAYGRLGRHYPRVFMALELQTAYPIILGTYALFSFYYEGDASTFFTLFGITCALAALSIVIACVKTARPSPPTVELFAPTTRHPAAADREPEPILASAGRLRRGISRRLSGGGD